MAISRLKEIPLPDRNVAYFDASAWNALCDHRDRDALLEKMRRGRVTVLGSVLSAAEIARTSSPDRRRVLCSLLRKVHGDGPLLEHPMEIAVPQARSILRGEDDFVMLAQRPTEILLRFLDDPTDEEIRQEFEGWIDRQHQRFDEAFVKLKPPARDSSTRFLTRDVVDSDCAREVLLGFTPAREAGLTLDDMNTIFAAEHDSIWTVLAAMLAYLLDVAQQHGGRDWRGAVDLWQTLYLGLPIHAFVTEDTKHHTAASRMRALSKESREVMTPEEFFGRL